MTMRALFVHSSVDDAGLSCTAFRVLAHLHRRADKRRRCYPSTTGIGDVCGMSRHAVIRAVKELERTGWVKVSRVAGKKSVYVLKQAGDPSPKRTCANEAPVSGSHRSQERTGANGAPHLCVSSTAPVRMEHTKVFQEGNPRRKSNPRAVREGACDAVSKGISAAAIYEAYPRKVGKLAGLRAIERAIRSGADPAALLERVKAFALASQGVEVRFIPHPATWFNQGRWMDGEESRESRAESRESRVQEASDGRVAVDPVESSEPPVETGPDEAHLAWLEAMRESRELRVQSTEPRAESPESRVGAEPGNPTETVVADGVGRVVHA